MGRARPDRLLSDHPEHDLQNRVIYLVEPSSDGRTPEPYAAWVREAPRGSAVRESELEAGSCARGHRSARDFAISGGREDDEDVVFEAWTSSQLFQPARERP
jgi:hypothetical protein